MFSEGLQEGLLRTDPPPPGVLHVCVCCEKPGQVAWGVLSGTLCWSPLELVLLCVCRLQADLVATAPGWPAGVGGEPALAGPRTRPLLPWPQWDTDAGGLKLPLIPVILSLSLSTMSRPWAPDNCPPCR